MKILLYDTLESSMDNPYEEFIATLADDLGASLDVVTIRSAKEMGNQALEDFRIVHVFGCWDAAAITLLEHAVSKNVPTVLSPLGGLQPWHMKQQRQWLCRRLRQMVEDAAAIHVGGQLERETFLRLGWNKNVATIKNPVFTSLISHEECARQFIALYRKVTDSNAARLLKADARRVLGQLLRLSVDTFALRYTGDMEQLKILTASLTEEDWRLMTLYASEENVLNPLALGLQRAGLPVPSFSPDAIECFPSGRNYTEGHLKQDALLSRNLLMKSRLHDYIYEKEKSERKLAIMIANLRYEIERRTAPLLHLLDLYEALRFDDMDEDRLAEILRILDLEHFSAHIMGVAQRVFGLQEGFMPIAPKDDKETTRLTRLITKFSI